MRILWLSHLVPYPPKGGVLQRSYYLLHEAAKRHQVDLVAFSQAAHQETDEELAVAEVALSEFCHDVETFPIRSDVRPWGRALLLAKSFVSRRPYDVNWLNASYFHEHLENCSEDYDLVHCDTVGLTQYQETVSSAPLVLNHHNVESRMMADRAEKESSIPRKLYMAREARKLERWERKWIGQASVNLVVSQLDEQRLRSLEEKVPVEVVENGVDVDYFRPRSPADDHDGHVVFVGGMSWYPNRDAMLWFAREIWPRLRSYNPSLRAQIIGREPPGELLRLASKGAGVNAPGFVDDIRPVVDRALAYVCPIRTGGGTRLKVLDALAMAKPLVATSFAVEGLGLEDGIHYLRAESPEEYAVQIRRLEEHPSLRVRLAEAGRDLVVDRYSWDVIGRNLEHAFQKAVHEEK